MTGLDARYIASHYTLAQIDARIVSYESALDAAMTGGYTLDTTQGRQSVSPSSPDLISKYLGIWLKARSIKDGTYTGPQLIHVNYTP
jgi:hypothetical protein